MQDRTAFRLWHGHYSQPFSKFTVEKASGSDRLTSKSVGLKQAACQVEWRR